MISCNEFQGAPIEEPDEPNDGGPVDVLTDKEGEILHAGLTIRDEFIKAVVTGCIANESLLSAIALGNSGKGHMVCTRAVAEFAINLADAVLAERNKIYELND